MCIFDSISCSTGGANTEIGGIVINSLRHLNNDLSTSTILAVKKQIFLMQFSSILI